MPSPTRFALGFLLGLGVVLAIFFARFYRQLGVPTETSRWCYEINAKKCLLAEAIPDHKLLLVGGSSTLFGLSAEQIQTQTGYPTVNLGTHAALGPEYIIHLAEQVAKPGDTVLISFEYEFYDFPAAVKTKGWNDSLFFDYLFARDPEYLGSLPLLQRCKFAMLISNQRLEEGLNNRRHPPAHIDTGIYDVKNINAFGDQIAHPAARRPASAAYAAQCCVNLAQGLSAQPKGFPTFELFCKRATQNHIRVLASFPSICHRPEYDLAPAQQATQAIRAFFESLGVPVLGEAQEAMLPSDQFFDTMYHLTDEGQREHTRRLLVHLAPLLYELDKPAQD
jgi:hypothetical protein